MTDNAADNAQYTVRNNDHAPTLEKNDKIILQPHTHRFQIIKNFGDRQIY